jgi:hypothetical protein
MLTTALIAAAILLLPVSLYAALRTKPSAVQIIRYLPDIEVLDRIKIEYNACV